MAYPQVARSSFEFAKVDRHFQADEALPVCSQWQFISQESGAKAMRNERVIFATTKFIGHDERETSCPKKYAFHWADLFHGYVKYVHCSQQWAILIRPISDEKVKLSLEQCQAPHHKRICAHHENDLVWFKDYDMTISEDVKIGDIANSIHVTMKVREKATIGSKITWMHQGVKRSARKIILKRK